MLVIVEGADLVGKSTLVERWVARYKLPVVKIRWALRGDPEIETRAMATTTVALLRALQPDVIFDRCYFSWWAYAPLLGYDASFMPEIIADFAPVEQARLILLTASEDELRRRYQRRPDPIFSLDVILGANARFPSLLTLPPSLPRLHLDTSALSPDEVFAQADAFVQMNEH